MNALKNRGSTAEFTKEILSLLGQERDFAAGATSRPRTGKPTGVPSFPAKTARSTPKSASSSPAPQRNFAPRSGLKGRPRAVDLTRAGRPEASRRRDPQRPQSLVVAFSLQGTPMSRDIFRPGSGQGRQSRGDKSGPQHFGWQIGACRGRGHCPDLVELPICHK